MPKANFMFCLLDEKITMIIIIVAATMLVLSVVALTSKYPVFCSDIK